MRNRWKLFIIIGVMFMIFTATPVRTEAAHVRLNQSRITMTVGKSKTLKVCGTKKKVKWTSSKKSVVKVSKNGKITARKKGTAKITAKVKGKKLVCRVKVLGTSRKSSGNTSKIKYVLALYDFGEECGNGQAVTIDVVNFPYSSRIAVNDCDDNLVSGTITSSSDTSIISVTNPTSSRPSLTVKKSGTVTLIVSKAGVDYRFTIKVNDPESGYKAKRAEIYKEVRITSSMPKQYKAFLLAAWICDNIHFYQGYSEGQTYQEALDKGTGVCAGYSELYKYLLEGQGIQCNNVATRGLAMNHEFSQVLLDDGCWYNVDVLLMDTNIDGSYFLQYFLQATDSAGWTGNDTRLASGHKDKELLDGYIMYPANSYRYDYIKLMENKKTKETMKSDGNTTYYDKYSSWLIGSWTEY